MDIGGLVLTLRHKKLVADQFILINDQMAEWYGASASGESGQSNDFKIGIHSFPA